jgi:PhnB protein
MTTVNIYLNFNGNCEEAFNFYKSVFGIEFSYFSRFKDMPLPEGMEPLSEIDGKRIMHVAIPISKETILMGSDTGGAWRSKFTQGNNFSVSLSADSKEAADRLFKGLSASGQVIMAMNTTFWGAYYGQFTDKFGINWMISFETEQN